MHRDVPTLAARSIAVGVRLLPLRTELRVSCGADRLFVWHAPLFPTGRSGTSKIKAGAWRDDSTGPMEVVSGPVAKERVHFQAPSAKRPDGEMRAFLDWFNASADMDPVFRAGPAHLWFVTIRKGT